MATAGYISYIHQFGVGSSENIIFEGDEGNTSKGDQIVVSVTINEAMAPITSLNIYFVPNVVFDASGPGRGLMAQDVLWNLYHFVSENIIKQLQPFLT